MDRWQHKIVTWEEPPLPSSEYSEFHRRQAEQMLDRIGDVGWELVNMRNFGSLNPPLVWTIWKRKRT